MTATATQIADLTASIEAARKVRRAAIRTGSTASSACVRAIDAEIVLCKSTIAELRATLPKCEQCGAAIHGRPLKAYSGSMPYLSEHLYHAPCWYAQRTDADA